jgi:hypothetical protein
VRQESPGKPGLFLCRRPRGRPESDALAAVAPRELPTPAMREFPVQTRFPVPAQAPAIGPGPAETGAPRRHL